MSQIAARPKKIPKSICSASGLVPQCHPGFLDESLSQVFGVGVMEGVVVVGEVGVVDGRCDLRLASACLFFLR